MKLFDNGNIKICFDPKSGDVYAYSGGELTDSRHILELVRLRKKPLKERRKPKSRKEAQG